MFHEGIDFVFFVSHLAILSACKLSWYTVSTDVWTQRILMHNKAGKGGRTKGETEGRWTTIIFAHYEDGRQMLQFL